MSIYSPRHWQKQKEDDKPFKIVTVEYFEEHELDDMRVINESNLTYLLINSVKELTKRVEELENEIKIIKTS